MKVFHFLFVLTLLEPFALGQENSPEAYNFAIGTGTGINISFNHLMNYYNYKGNSFPVDIKMKHQINHHLFSICFSGQYSKLTPVNKVNPLYSYNFIRHQFYTLCIDYLKSLINDHSNIRIYLGVVYSTHFLYQHEYYNSLLYDFTNGHRKTFDLSLFSISPEVVCAFQKEKNHIQIQFSYAPFTLSAKPNDQFIKQLHAPGRKLFWKIYTPDEYSGIKCSLAYHREIYSCFTLFSELKVQYLEYTKNDEFKYFNKQVIVGLSKSF